MFINFNTIDFIVLGTSVFFNIVFIICIIVLSVKKKEKKSVLDTVEEVKVTKINNDEEVTAFEDIIEAMQKDIDSKAEDAVELFEQEQEEKAIISYQELLDVKNKGEAKPQKIEILTDETFDTKELEVSKTEQNQELLPEPKFTNSEFVSPVFGKMDRNIKNNVQIEVEDINEYDNFDLEKTLNIEPLIEEIKNNNDFLNALKEFRKNL